MSLWRQLTRSIRALTNRSAADHDVADEVQHYLEQATAEHVARGLSPEAALRAAKMELGGVTRVREQVRGHGWENLVETVAADVRFAARRLRTEPGFTLVTVLTLALGIGASTAIFSAVNPILFQSLPYPEAGRIMTIWDNAGESRAEATFNTYREVRERARSFEALAAFKPWQPTLKGGPEPERLEGQRVSWEYFRVLGIAPALGQDFAASDDRPGEAGPVILSANLWRRRFAADPAIIGRPVTLDGETHLVAGVMPATFENVLAPSAELWIPLQYEMTEGRAWGHHLRIVGRLRPGVTGDEGSGELNFVAGNPVAEFPRVPWASLEGGLLVTSLHDEMIRGVKPALLAIMGAVFLVLVIACVNVTNLLLARGSRRRAEYALRSALGAGQGRLVRQLLTECLFIAALGGIAGLVLAVLGVRVLLALSPPGLPRVDAIGVDAAAFAFGFAVTTLIGLAFGLTPALQASRTDPERALQHGSRRTTGGRRRTQSALVVAEVALALVLLVSSGLLFRSLQRLFAVEVGFDSANLLTLQVYTSGQQFTNDSTTYRFFTQALDAVRDIPGVTAAALTNQLPLSGDRDLYGVHFEQSSPDDLGELLQGTFRYAVSPGYFETMGIPLRRGRLLDEQDRAGATPVALISETMARRRLPGLDPIGRRLQIGDGVLYTIVGVVGDIKQMSLALNESDAVYITASQWRFADNTMSLVIRARGDAAAFAPLVRRAVWSVDKDQPIVRVATMEDLLAASAAERRFALIVFEAFALSALVLAAAGIYGVMSANVAERNREIGVRSALGASRGDILALIVRQGMTLTGLGVVLGLLGAVAATQLVVTMLFGVSRLDPATYLGVIVLLVSIATIACGVPAWRAARVDPATTLRAD
jgi:putative ABC transport system permease protein